MKIVIPAWHVKNPNVGLGRYQKGLIHALAERDDHHDYTVFVPLKTVGFPQHRRFRCRQLVVPVFKRRVWEQVAAWSGGSYDILHFPYDSCVLWKGGRFVVTIHDVKPLLFDLGRQTPPLLERLIVRDRRRMVDHVVTDSEASRRDIIRLLAYPAEQVTVVYPGVDLARFRPADTVSSTRPYVLSVAGADPTKNVETLIDAYAELPEALRREHQLVLAGDFRRRADLKQRVAERGLDRETVFPGVVSDERLIELYQQASAFVFPSRYEGFGLPVLEAMACGCPVISSNASSLPEVVGEAGLLREPSDVHGFGKDLERVLTDGALCTELRRAGLARAAQFSWKRTAAELVGVYERVATY